MEKNLKRITDICFIVVMAMFPLTVWQRIVGHDLMADVFQVTQLVALAGQLIGSFFTLRLMSKRFDRESEEINKRLREVISSHEKRKTNA